MSCKIEYIYIYKSWLIETHFITIVEIRNSQYGIIKMCIPLTEDGTVSDTSVLAMFTYFSLALHSTLLKYICIMVVNSVTQLSFIQTWPRWI